MGGQARAGVWLGPVPSLGGTRRGDLSTSCGGVYMNPLSWYNGYYLAFQAKEMGMMRGDC